LSDIDRRVHHRLTRAAEAAQLRQSRALWHVGERPASGYR
jgi:hypothetical protein